MRKNGYRHESLRLFMLLFIIMHVKHPDGALSFVSCYPSECQENTRPFQTKAHTTTITKKKRRKRVVYWPFRRQLIPKGPA